MSVSYNILSLGICIFSVHIFHLILEFDNNLGIVVSLFSELPRDILAQPILISRS